MAHDVKIEEIEGVNGFELKCTCGNSCAVTGTKDIPNVAVEFQADIAAIKHCTQGFFADFAAEMRKPHFGDMQRSWMQALLTRAIEAKLYTPEDV